MSQQVEVAAAEVAEDPGEIPDPETIPRLFHLHPLRQLYQLPTKSNPC